MRSLARAFQGAQLQARDTARATLSNAAGALTGAGTGLQPVANTQISIDQGNTKRRADLGQAIGSGLGALSKLDFGGGGYDFGGATSATARHQPGNTQIEQIGRAHV